MWTSRWDKRIQKIEVASMNHRMNCIFFNFSDIVRPNIPFLKKWAQKFFPSNPLMHQPESSQKRESKKF